MVIYSSYTTPWSAPPSPAPVSPLNIRKASVGVRESRAMSRNMSNSPASTRDISPSSQYSRDSAYVSQRNSRMHAPAENRRQSTRSMRSARSTRSHGFSGKVCSHSHLVGAHADVIKSPIEESDYSGLQVDDRPEFERGKALPPLPSIPPAYRDTLHLPPFPEEKRSHFPDNDNDNHPLLRGNTFQAQYNNTFRTQYHRNTVTEQTMKEAVAPRTAIHQTVELNRQNRVKRRRRLWILGAIVILIVIAAVIVGSILGTQKRASEVKGPQPSSSPSSPLVTPTAAPDVINQGLPPKDIQVDSQMVPIQFTANTSNNGQSAGQQNFGMWYQNKCGNVKGVQNSGSWDPYGTAFTDSVNVSGLAGIGFFNDSIKSFQTYLFYVGVDGKIRDKKLNPADNTFEIGSLASMHVGVNAAPSSALADNSSNPWDGYKMAAVYSDNFPQGPGARLFYHSSNGSSSYLQELIWVQATDKWSFGTTLGTDALPVSHLSMVADEGSGVVRLMYAAGSNASTTDADASPGLQEYYMQLGAHMADGGYWKKGQRFEGLLGHGSSAFALAASGGSSFLYRVAPLNSSGPALQVQELTLPAANGSQPLDTAAAETVAIPDWLSRDTAGREPSLYTPLAAVGSNGTLTVFFADGTEDALAGYDRITTVSRQQGKSWPPATYGQAPGQVELPLDSKCAVPQI